MNGLRTPDKTGKPDRDTVLDVACAVLIALACILFPTDWLADIFGGAENTACKLAALAAVRFLFGGAGVYFLFYFKHPGSIKLKAKAFRRWDVLLAALLVSVNNFPFIGLLSRSVVVEADTGTMAAYLLFCLSVGFFEEIYFRGLVFPMLLKAYGETKKGVFLSVLLSAVLFGAVHLFNLIGNWGAIGPVLLQTGYSALIGAMLALTLYYTECIWFPVILHAVYDVGGLLTQYAASGTIWDVYTVALTVLVGVGAGVYLLLRFLRTFRVKEQDPAEPAPQE